MALKKSSKALVDEAMALIKTERIDQVSHLAGGFNAWKVSGAPVVEKPKSKPKPADG